MSNLRGRGSGSGVSSTRGRPSHVAGAPRLKGSRYPQPATSRGRGHDNGRGRSISGRGPWVSVREPTTAAKIASSVHRLATTQNYRRAMNEVIGNFPVHEWAIPQREMDSDPHFEELVNYKGKDIESESQVPETEFPYEDNNEDRPNHHELNREDFEEMHYSDERMNPEHVMRRSESLNRENDEELHYSDERMNLEQVRRRSA